PPNVSPHDYQFSPKDLRKLREADLMVLNGLGLEDWLKNALQEQLLHPAARVLEVAAGLHDELIYPEGKPSPRQPRLANPHIWLDARLAAHAVTNILRALETI